VDITFLSFWVRTSWFVCQFNTYWLNHLDQIIISLKLSSSSVILWSSNDAYNTFRKPGFRRNLSGLESCLFHINSEHLGSCIMLLKPFLTKWGY
jgi:hypothetical protein